jgi:hypothetical protein
MQKLLKHWLKLNIFLENRKIATLIVLCIYVAFLCLVSYYHEPWHDEGQAWLIARDDSLWHLFAATTHWEGHPPLWYLLLMPLAKAGVSFPLGLKFINISLCTLAMGLLIFKSPFPWYLRFSLPFTYFCFYQYGVISRTYSLLMFGLMLTAYYYPQRQQKPWPLAFSLALVSGAQAYGMMLSLGIALCWSWEWLKNRWDNQCRGWKLFYPDAGEGRALLFLLVISLIWGLTMLPFAETAYTSVRPSPFWENLFYSFFIIPSQFFREVAAQDNVYDYAFTFFQANLQNYIEMIPSYGAFAYAILAQYLLSHTYGLMFQGLTLFIARHLGLTKLFVLPSLGYFILISLVFAREHHTGILFLFYIFFYWQVFAASSAKQAILAAKFRKQFTKAWEYSLVKVLLGLAFVWFLGLNIYWSIYASWIDYKFPYDSSQAVAEFLKQDQLRDKTFWVGWPYYDNDTKAGSGSHNINAFFTTNRIQNLNGGHSPYSFLAYRTWDKDTYEEQLRNLGQPDLFFGDVSILNKVFAEHHSYVPVKAFIGKKVYKTIITENRGVLYVREDLLPRLSQLKRMDVSQ